MNENQLTKKQLPKLEELYNDLELISKQSQLLVLLNNPPKKEWLKTNPFANNTTYLPIARVEYLLTTIFLKWRVEIKESKVIANAVVCTVRLHVQDPITGEWDWQDGIGASPIQTKQGAAATDFTQVNTAAVQMSAPAAESYAIKDAAEKFGKIFGKDLNRKDEINYMEMLYNKVATSDAIVEIPEELKFVIAECDEETKLTAIYNNAPELKSNPEFMRLLNSRRVDLKSKK